MKADGYVVIETDLDTSGLEEGLDEARSEIEEFQKDAGKAISKDSFSEAEAGASALGTELSATTEGALMLGGAIAAIGGAIVFKKLHNMISGIRSMILSIPSAMLNIVKSVAKWTLGLFGVKSAYHVIKNAVSSVMTSNEQVKNQIDVMKGALASAIEPLVSRVVNLVYTLFSYINQIVKALTGKDLFAQAKKNLASGAKSSKEINNQLASFDEMNVLKDNKGADSGGGLNLPDVDSAFTDFLEKIKNLFLDGDLGGIATLISQKIVSGLNKIADTIASIDFASIGKKISDFLTHIDFSGILVGLVRVFGEAVLGLQDLILAIDWPRVFKNLGKGIADAFGKIDEYVNKIRFDEIGKKVSDTFTSIPWSEIAMNIRQTIFDVIGGIGEFFLNIDWGNVAKTISDFLNDMYIQIQLFFDQTDWTMLGADIADAIFNFLENVDWANLSLNILLALLYGLQAVWDLALGFIAELFQRIIDKVKEVLGISSPSTVFAEMGKFIIEGFVNGIKSIMNTVIDVFKTIWNKIKEIFSNVGNWFKEKFSDAWNKIKSVFSTVGSFFGGIWNTIKEKFTSIGTKVGESVSMAFKGVINGILNAVESIINKAIRGINTLIKGLNVVADIIHLGHISELKNVSLPRMAKGGIVNMPGKGVLVGGALTGETRPEGVIPLTDSQMMATLGEAIGKNVPITINLTNTMNGRVISRELIKINNENDFAYNR